MSTPLARYDAIADFYETFAPDAYDDTVAIALLEIIGDVSGLRLLDLACGQGRFSREMARCGAHVTGIDLSAAQLERAYRREQENPLGITYIHDNAASPDALAGQSFDAVVCHYGLSDIDDLDGVIATVVRVLRPGGFFAFSIVHPCFPGWESTSANPSWQPGSGYFQEGWWIADGPANGIRPKVGANHRMVSTYLNTLTRNGLILEEMREPEPPMHWLNAPPAVGPVPIYLVARCRKDSD
jgi:SAM-dependent methyltransferase